MKKTISAVEVDVSAYARILSDAIRFATASKAVEVAKFDLDCAYLSWKHQNRVTCFVERGSVTWKSMMLGTKIYYRVLVNAKARKRRAEKKLIAKLEG